MKKRKNKFNNSTVCHICDSEFVDEIKVKDHCHLSGKFRGAAHVSCNLNLKLPDKIPVICHNSSNYDTHLFITALSEFYNKVDLIANTDEKYINFTVNTGWGYEFESSKARKFIKLSFIDSYRFLGSSIDSLSKNLKIENFIHLNNYICNNEQLNDILERKENDQNEIFNILSGKGIFPYEFIDTLDKLNYNKILKRYKFYSTLNHKNITDREYLHYKMVWGKLKEKTLGNYSDLYNIQDVLLLSDIFENFRNVCLSNYKLDPAHYLTAPSLAWDAMLKMTKIELECLNDIDMYLMVEKGIRGGIAQCIKRYAKANNKYTKKYKIYKKVKYLAYLDCNNLYGDSLSQYLPYKDFEFLNPKNHTKLEWIDIIMNKKNDDEEGYIFDVDLEYPKVLHDAHKDFPLAPEHYNNKLCTTLFDKTDYIVHYRNLKYYLERGLILKSVNRVINFKQKPYIKEYVDFNTNMRTKAKSAFEKDFYKLMNNSVFGKTMENVRNRCDIKLGNEEYSLKFAKKPNFKHFKIFNENCIATHMIKQKVKFDKPIYIGFSVLDLSKLLMYEFFYDKLKKWDPEIKLLYMDTDSFFLEFTLDPYKIIKKNIIEFDTSDFNPKDKCYSIKNKKVIGKFKDEMNGIPLEEFCGLRAKCYSYSWNDKNDNKNVVKNKGIKKNLLMNEKINLKELNKKDKNRLIKLDNFKRCLFTGKTEYRENDTIRSFGHKLYTIKTNKLALNPKDDKRCVLENKIDTLPWGHKDIK